MAQCVLYKVACFYKFAREEQLLNTMPMVFQKDFQSCAVIIDCFEVFIERQTSLKEQAQTRSDNTAKFLISAHGKNGTDLNAGGSHVHAGKCKGTIVLLGYWFQQQTGLQQYASKLLHTLPCRYSVLPPLLQLVYNTSIP